MQTVLLKTVIIVPPTIRLPDSPRGQRKAPHGEPLAPGRVLRRSLRRRKDRNDR